MKLTKKEQAIVSKAISRMSKMKVPYYSCFILKESGADQSLIKKYERFFTGDNARPINTWTPFTYSYTSRVNADKILPVNEIRVTMLTLFLETKGVL